MMVAFGLKAQVPLPTPTAVIDVQNAQINTTNWAQSLAKTSTQIKTLTESKTLLEQSIQLYSKVSSTISNAQIISDMINRQVVLVSYINTELKRTDYQSLAAYSQYRSNLIMLLETNKYNISFLKTLISSEAKMNDGQRLALMRDVNKESKITLAQFFRKRDIFNELNDNIRVVKSLKTKK